MIIKREKAITITWNNPTAGELSQGRKILQDDINAQNTWQFRDSPGQCARVGISREKRWRIEQFIILRKNRSGWHVVKHSLSLTSVEEKKNRAGSRNPATTKMELYVAKLFDLLLKRNKKI